MTDSPNHEDLNQLLETLSDEIAVSPSKYREAKEHYEAVGAWLADDDGELALFEPVIYVQGSFALGTAIKPLGDEEYDVDAVCELDITNGQFTQQELKQIVGERLKYPKSRYKDMIDPPEGGRRCWTIKYAEGSSFHLDVLPARPDDYSWLVELGVPPEWAESAIRITDRTTWDIDHEGPPSNPKGYAAWFKSRMGEQLEKARQARAAETRAEVEDIEDFDLTTPLQQLVQLLKRHRDLLCGDDEDKPVSIIITTLAAQAFRGESNPADALLKVVPRTREFVEQRANEWWVPNPVNPHENFANKWNETPRKPEVFNRWLESLERKCQLLAVAPPSSIGEIVEEAFGVGRRRAVVPASQSRPAREASQGQAGATSARFDVSHREAPSWPQQMTHYAGLRATATREGWQERSSTSGFPRIQKGFSLWFELSTTAPAPYDIYWQVVNTGTEAVDRGDLRGGIFRGERVHKESTAYSGFHWIEGFVVKRGQLVARTGEFVVSIE